MLKKIIASSVAIILSAALSVTAFADENSGIFQYSCAGEEITVYAGDVSGKTSCRIAGVDCNSEIVGNVYSDEEKFKTLFLIDTSRSMEGFSDDISAFLLECIDKKQDNEYFAIAEFGSAKSPFYLSEFDNRQYPLEKVVQSIKYDDESSYIFDNLKNAANDLASDGESCFKRIVLFTDGCENSAYGITIEDVLAQLSETPFQVYTVTFLNGDKSNYDKLKNAARLATNTHASDIRINADSDPARQAQRLIDDAKNIYRIKITTDLSLCDGSIKALELSSENGTVIADIRMPMITIQTTQSETESETATVSEPLPEPEKAEFPIVPIAAAAGGLIVAAVVVIIVLNTHKKKENSPVLLSEQTLNDTEDTLMLSTRGGDTEMLFGDSGVGSSIILRDVANSAHTFEASLSGDIIIGRSSDVCSLVIDYDKSISKRHCRIFKSGGEIMIEDLGSSNKTYVNDVEVLSPKPIHTADEIKIGRVRFKVAIH